MRLKTYSAPTLNEAMSMVRNELGGEAVIVSTVELEHEVRLTAALEEQEVMNINDLAPLPSHSIPGLELICQKLEDHNVSQHLSEQILNFCSEHRKDEIGPCLVASLRETFRFTAPPHESIPILLVGSPGVGKTVTITRMACQARSQGYPVHIITTDAQKAGSLSQISSLGTTHDLSISIAHSAQNLVEEVNKVPLGTSLLIDTPGINPFNKDELSRLAELILAVRVSPVLALPAGGDRVEQQEFIDAFSTIGTSRILLTKMDLSRRLGGLLDAIHATRSQMMAYGNSPDVTRPLHKMSPEALALLLLDDTTKHSQKLAA